MIWGPGVYPVYPGVIPAEELLQHLDQVDQATTRQPTTEKGLRDSDQAGKLYHQDLPLREEI